MKKTTLREPKSKKPKKEKTAKQPALKDLPLVLDVQKKPRNPRKRKSAEIATDEFVAIPTIPDTPTGDIFDGFWQGIQTPPDARNFFAAIEQ